MTMLIEVEKIARSPSRSGRQLQRYDFDRRQVVGCIPYRFRDDNLLEVLLISSQKSDKMMFPKGGWESDESKEQALLREALEEAGVTGSIKFELGNWIYKSKSQDKMHDGHMFALFVEQQLDEWPEKDVRKRKWVNVEEARRLCPYQWMIEALDSLIDQLPGGRMSKTEEPLSPRSPLSLTSSLPPSPLSPLSPSSSPLPSPSSSSPLSSSLLSSSPSECFLEAPTSPCFMKTPSSTPVSLCSFEAHGNRMLSCQNPNKLCDLRSIVCRNWQIRCLEQKG